MDINLKTVERNIFVEEIALQVSYMKLATNNLPHALEHPKGRLMVHALLHQFFVSAATVSLVFWPSEKGGSVEIRKRRKARGERLRIVFEINDDNVLKSRKLRNHFMHTDERLDEWLQTSKNHNFMRLNLHEIELTGPGIQPTDIIEEYYRGSQILLFRGERFSFPEYKSAMEHLDKKVQIIKYNKINRGKSPL